MKVLVTVRRTECWEHIFEVEVGDNHKSIGAAMGAAEAKVRSDLILNYDFHDSPIYHVDEVVKVTVPKIV